MVNVCFDNVHDFVCVVCFSEITLLLLVAFVNSAGYNSSKPVRKYAKLIENAKVVLVYLGVFDRYSRDEQIDDCRKMVKALELPRIGRSVFEHNELDDLLLALRNDGTELVLLPRLSVLSEHGGRGVGGRFLNNLIKVTNQSMMIMDVHKELDSHQYSDWYAHIKTTLNTLTNSRKPPKGQMSNMGTLRHIKHRGIVKHWTEYVDKKTFERMAQHWRDPRHKNAKIAIASFPDDELCKLSRKTVERIFGNRT